MVLMIQKYPWLAVFVICAALLGWVQTCEYAELTARPGALDTPETPQAQPAQPQPQQQQPPAPPTTSSTEIPGDVLAIQNKNPLNVKDLGKLGPWKGQIGKDRHGHAIFSDWEYGVRAASLTLRAYARKHGVDTLQKLVERFSTNNHTKYTAFLARRLNVAPDEKIDLVRRMPELLRHMARFECGQHLPEHLLAPYDILEKL